MTAQSRGQYPGLPLQELVASVTRPGETIPITTALIAGVAPLNLNRSISLALSSMDFAGMIKRESTATASLQTAQARYDEALAKVQKGRESVRNMDKVLDEISAAKQGVEVERIGIVTARVPVTVGEKMAILARNTRAEQDRLGRGARIRRGILFAFVTGGVFAAPGAALVGGAYYSEHHPSASAKTKPSDIHDAKVSGWVLGTSFGFGGVAVGIQYGARENGAFRKSDKAAQRKAKKLLGR